MKLISKIYRCPLHWVLKILLILVLSSALAACAVYRSFEKRASQMVESLTGMQCVIASVRPCFPCGIKATGITIFSSSGRPFLQAKEISTQVNPLRYLQRVKQKDLLNNLQCDGVQLTLVRKADGEWELPRCFNQSFHESAGGRPSPRHLLLTDVSVLVKTPTGEAARSYKRISADLDPARQLLTFQVTGTEESALIVVKKGAVKEYELEAENLSLALLATASTSTFPLENMELSGNLKATSSDHQNYAVQGRGKFRFRSIHHAVVSSRMIDEINLPFDLKANLTSSGVEELEAKINLAGETATIRGSVDGCPKPVIDIGISFDNFSYDRALAALPLSLHPSLPTVRLSGTMTGTFKVYLDLADPQTLDYRFTGYADPLQIVNLGQEIRLEYLKAPFAHKIRTKGSNDMVIPVSQENPDFTPYNRIPRSLISAVMMAEDGSFYTHRGFSTRHIRGSLIDNLKAGRVVRGASTITMQLAKNLFLSPERTLSRKLEEALYTVALEQSLDKRRIMEIYLNIIEWGDGIYGIGPAARYYFNKRPIELTAVESAFLASIIARPKNWPPGPLAKIRQGWRHYVQVLVWKMYQTGHAEVEDLLQAGVSEARILDTLMEEEPDDQLGSTPVGG